MSRVYSARKCDVCGTVYEGTGTPNGMRFMLNGDTRYYMQADSQIYVFEDACDRCRSLVCAALRPVLGLKSDPEA